MDTYSFSASIIKDVWRTYESYISSHDSIDDYVREEFDREKRWVEHELWNCDFKKAIARTISIYEYLDEHNAVHPRIQYPGPTKLFKIMVDKDKHDMY